MAISNKGKLYRVKECTLRFREKSKNVESSKRGEKLKREKLGKMQLAAKQVAYYLAKGGILFCKKRSADDRYKNNSTRSINI